MNKLYYLTVFYLNILALVPGPSLGHTTWGLWTEFERCPLLKKITGFRIRVEADVGGGDDTGLNSIQFSCEGVTNTGELKSPFGTWTSWTTCNDDGFVERLDVRGTRSRPGDVDDYGATNVRIECSGGDIQTGGGLSHGDWVGFQGCPTGYYICGARAQIEGFQGGNVDDTALNRIQLGCCLREKGKSFC